MSAWSELAAAVLGSGALAALLGHRRAKKVAAKAAQVLAWAREASYLVCQVLRTVGKADAARAISLWSTEFATLAAAAGADVTAAQHTLAAAEARHTIGRVAMAQGLDDLKRAMDQFEPVWAVTESKIRELEAEQKAAKAKWEKKHGGGQ